MIRFGFFTLLILTSLLSPAMAGDWPQFRGPGGQGHSTATGLPVRWSEDENIAWKVPVEGVGWSSPVVLDNKVWMTTAVVTLATAEESEKFLAELGMPVPRVEVARRVTLEAVCLDARTGRLLDTLTLFDDAGPLQICSVNSYASPTPVGEPGRLYCDFGTMGTACVDTASGDILWKRRLRVEHQVGPGSSPILHGKLLVLVRDGCDVQYVTALDKTTGQTAWRTERPPIDAPQPYYRKSFSTPLVFAAADGEQMIVPAAQWIVSYDPDSGTPVWRVDTGGTFSNASRPVFGHGLAFVSTAFGGSQLLAIRVDGRGDVTDTHVAWQTRKQVPRISSPLLVGDELYVVSDKGVASCLDARSGDVRWTERVLSGCSASPVYADGRVYLFGEMGKTAVLRPGRQFALLAENELDGRIMASPAIVDGAFFLRTDTHLYRIEEE